MSRLLLHSLAEFRELIVECLDLVEAKSVVEIGGEGGTFTGELLTWAGSREARVICIDPAPSDALVEMIDRSPAGELRRTTSLDALADMEPADVYLIDGDHNYYTLSHELRAIEAGSGDHHRPLLFLHDVGWPAGRRDMYYSPDSLPADAVHPYTHDEGVKVGCAGVVEGGFRGEGEFAWALVEGGPGNGVLTAVEDFLTDRPELEYRAVPCVFGLGVLYARSSSYADRLGAVLEVYDGNPLLARLEENRLTLYLRVLEQQHEALGLHRSLEDWILRTRDVEVENRGLWARVAELEGQVGEMSARYAALAGEVDTMVRARSFAVAEALSRLHSRLGDSHGISRERLRALLDGAPAEGGGRPESLGPPLPERTTPRPAR